MTTTRICVACGADMEARPSFGIEIDICPRCGGVFLDGGEAEMQGVDTSALFGVAARDLGLTNRPCPAHRTAMRRFRLDGARGPVDIERADCCGGIFLDPGEQGELAAAAAHAARLAGHVQPPMPSMPADLEPSAHVKTATGAVFALPPEQGGTLGGVMRGVLAHTGKPAELPAEINPQEPTGRHCPRCKGEYRADRKGGTEIDVCVQCGSLFFDPGELDARGIDTAALFGQGPEAAQAHGPSELSCPACNVPMEVVRVTTLAGILEVDRAKCCGGLFLDGGEHDAFARAARVATQQQADRQFLQDGHVVGEAAIQSAIAASSASHEGAAAFVRARVDAALHEMHRRRYERLLRRFRWHRRTHD